MRLEKFLQENNLILEGRISKGYCSEVFLVKDVLSEKEFALKFEKEKSCRKSMVEKEVENLKLANSLGIGPKLFGFDVKARAVLLEFVQGISFNTWLLEKTPSKKQVKFFVNELLKQARKLDKAGLDHGQLAGKGKNILVRKTGNKLNPVIIDFEKASQCRKSHNRTQLESFLFKNPNSVISRKVRGVLGEEIIKY